jgi:hypothetical protein
MTFVAMIDIGVGQSGMMNYGVTGVSFPGGWTSDSGIKIWNSTTSAWETYAPGTNALGSNSALWGPEAEFLRQKRLARPDVPRYFMKLAVGGTPVAAKGAGVDDWSVWSNSTDATKHWGGFYNMFGSAVAALPAGAIAVVEDILSVDGETDGTVLADANAFYYNKKASIAAFRQKFVAQNAHFIMSRTKSNFVGGNPITYVSTIQAAMDKLAVADPRNASVNVDDLAEASAPYQGHLNAAATVTQGLRMFQASQALST